MKTDVKFRAGKYLVPGSLTNTGNGTIEVRFRYNAILLEEIKSFEGSRWNPDKKLWTIKDTQRNMFQMEYLLGGNPYARWDAPLTEYHSQRPLRNHQLTMTRQGLTYHNTILAAEMGCIDGKAVIHCNRARRGFETTIEKLFFHFHGGTSRGKQWDLTIPTYIRSLCNGELRLNKIINVLHKGYQKVVKMTTASGKSLILTPDHEILTDDGYQAIQNCTIGTIVMCNGKWLDKDGYYRVGGLKNDHPRWTTGGVYEHILVMEAKLGRYVRLDEIVHHKNEIKHDNHPDNLELLPSSSVHAALHADHLHFNSLFIPHTDVIVSIEEAGSCSVFDIVCDNPHRNFVANGIIVHNCGKSLSAIEIIENAAIDFAIKYPGQKFEAMWVAPRSALRSVELELEKWSAKVKPALYTYEGLTKLISQWPQDKKAPYIVVFDESSRAKSPTAKRSQAAFELAKGVRNDWEGNGYVILMSGTPAPKSPADWWMQCEITQPGFIREGTYQKFQQRLGLIVQKESIQGGVYPHLVTWRDDANKCNTCGLHKSDACHDSVEALFSGSTVAPHSFVPSVNEVADLYERMKGLVLVVFKKDCLDLPEKQYEIIRCKPSGSTLRSAAMITAKSTTVIGAMVLLRELSDGFQYEEEETGTIVCSTCRGVGEVEMEIGSPDIEISITEENIDEYRDAGVKIGETYTIPRSAVENTDAPEKEITSCPKCGGAGETATYKRTAVQVPCPKEDATKELLDRYEDVGRTVWFAGFSGSIDRLTDIVSSVGWDYIRVDGRGWFTSIKGVTNPLNMLKIFQSPSEEHPRVAFIANPGSGGMGLTLTASPMICFYSNDFNAESRQQAEDRIHRMGMDHNRGATIIDLIHLPTDELVLNNLQKKKKLQALSMGEINEVMKNINPDAERKL